MEQSEGNIKWLWLLRLQVWVIHWLLTDTGHISHAARALLYLQNYSNQGLWHCLWKLKSQTQQGQQQYLCHILGKEHLVFASRPEVEYVSIWPCFKGYLVLNCPKDMIKEGVMEDPKQVGKSTSFWLLCILKLGGVWAIKLNGTFHVDMEKPWSCWGALEPNWSLPAICTIIFYVQV